MNKERKGLLKNIASLGLVQIANNVLPLLSIPIVSRIIGPDNFGLINFDFSIVAYFSLFISYGFELTATRRVSKAPDDVENRNRVFTEVFYSQCILFIISVVAFAIIIFQIPLLSNHKSVAVFSFIYCIASVLTQNWLFQAMQDLHKVALFNFLSKLMFTVAVLALIHKKSDFYWHPLCLSLIQVLVAIISFIWAIKKYKIVFVKVKISECFKLLFNERTVFFSMAVIVLYTTTNTVILGLFKNDIEVGYYTAGQRLIYVLNTVITIPMSVALFPYIGRAFAASKNQGLEIAQKILPLIIIFTGLAALLMFFVGPTLLLLFYGKRFGSSIPVFKILALIPMLLCINNIMGVQIMLNLKMDKSYFKINAGAALLSLSLNFLLINKWGYIESAFNWLAVESFNCICLFCVLRYNQINPINLKYWNLSGIKNLVSTIVLKKQVKQ